MSTSAVPALVADGEAPPAWVRLRSWLGVVPLGAFVVLHLALQSSAMGGFRSYEQTVGWLRDARWIWIPELLGLYLPLSFHALTGVYLLVSHSRGGRSSTAIAPSQLQAASGVVLLAFVGFHVWQFRVRSWLGELTGSDHYRELCASLSSTAPGGIPLTAAFYLVGVAAVAFHLAQGCHALLATRVDGPRRALLGRSCLALGIGLFCLGSLIVIELATGSFVVSPG